jgi:methylmalonyl-CoA mutase
VTAKIGFLNKSLKDPYTNLLRQTTEVMSAAMGGASQVLCFPYDTASSKGSSEFSQRMATNISLILKEESYLNQVLDAVGGSYAIEQLTEMLADKAWTLFQEIEKQGGLKSSDLMRKIEQTAQKRVELYKSKQKTLIGINKFPNPDTFDLQWKINNSTYFGLKQLILENEIN